MKIDSHVLTSCEVVEDGGAITLGFVGTSGSPANIRFSLDQVSAIAMTPPVLISMALRTCFQDQSLRYAYPLGSWVLEQSSDSTQNMIRLRSLDGFSVCFSIHRQQQIEVG